MQGLDAVETERAISFCGHAIHEDEVFLVGDATRDERFADNPLVAGGPEIRLYAGRPVHSPDGSRIGTLCVIDRQPRELDQDDLEALDDLATLVETELRVDALRETEKELRKRLSEVERRAALAPPTRLWNRKIGATILQEEVERSLRKGLTIGVMLADIDHFKKVNDKHGHLAGDAVIVATAARMRAALRTYDSVARYGGEEFMAVLPECSHDVAVVIGERLRKRVRSRPVRTDAGALRVTVSVGVCSFRPEKAIDPRRLLARADEALYEAKRSGRDRVVVATLEG